MFTPRLETYEVGQRRALDHRGYCYCRAECSLICPLSAGSILIRHSWIFIMSSRKSRPPSDDDDSSGPRIPPVPQRGRHSDEEYYRSPKKQRRRSRYGSGRGYEMGREKLTKVDVLLCVFHGAPSHRWRTAPYSFDRRRINDVELWEDIRSIYRDDLQKAWRRIFGLKKLKAIIPIEVPDLATHNPTPSHYEHRYENGLS